MKEQEQCTQPKHDDIERYNSNNSLLSTNDCQNNIIILEPYCICYATSGLLPHLQENKMDTNHVFYAALDGIIAKEAFDSIVAGFNIASLPEDVWTSAYAAARLCLSPQPPHRKWWM